MCITLFITAIIIAIPVHHLCIICVSSVQHHADHLGHAEFEALAGEPDILQHEISSQLE